MLSVINQTSKNLLKNLKIDDSNSTVGMTNSSNVNCQKIFTKNTTMKNTFSVNSKDPNNSAKGNLPTININPSLNSAGVRNRTNTISNTNEKSLNTKKAAFSDKFFKK
jgi:hypothetical protein